MTHALSGGGVLSTTMHMQFWSHNSTRLAIDGQFSSATGGCLFFGREGREKKRIVVLEYYLLQSTCNFGPITTLKLQLMAISHLQRSEPIWFFEREEREKKRAVELEYYPLLIHMQFWSHNSTKVANDDQFSSATLGPFVF